jgi:hypothetical protein
MLGISLLFIFITFIVFNLGHPFARRWISRLLHREPEWWFDFGRFVLFYISIIITLITVIKTQQARESAEESRDELQKKVESLSPYRQPIVTLTATMQIVVKSYKQIERISQGRGASLVFTKGEERLLWAESGEYEAVQLGNGRVRFSSDLTMSIYSPARGDPISLLQGIDSIKLVFHAIGIGNTGIEMNTEILYGRLICNVNNVITLTFPIPSQRVQGKEIFIPDIDKVLQTIKP